MLGAPHDWRPRLPDDHLRIRSRRKRIRYSRSVRYKLACNGVRQSFERLKTDTLLRQQPTSGMICPPMRARMAQDG